MVDCAFVYRNVVQTLLLNQFFFESYFKLPRLVKLFVFFFDLDSTNSFEFAQVLCFLYFFCSCRPFFFLVRSKLGKRVEIKHFVKISFDSYVVFDILYNFFSLILTKVDVYRFKSLRGFFTHGYSRRFVVYPGYVFRIFDLRGVSFFDRCAVFLQWRNFFSLVCYISACFRKRPERLVLLRNWKFGF
jgi:hypothetical protein